ncbi:MAG: phosphoribosyl transferase [Thermofilum sp. ex4484_79]|nr:MAG: phosphoribosyl transferase [Thermofilum sp. ex4484_79]
MVSTLARVNTKLVSWEEVVEWAYELSKRIKESEWRPDIVIAISRGGYVPARMLCDFLDIHDLVSIQILHWGKAAEITAEAHVKYPLNIDLSGKKALLVDDICDTGDSIIVAKEYIVKNCKPAEIKTAVMQWISSVAKIKPEYYVDEVKDWVWYQYPWTRAEDTTNFFEKILNEHRKESKLEWTFEELINEFKEWYGIDVGKKYYDLAISRLSERKMIKIEDNRIKVL